MMCFPFNPYTQKNAGNWQSNNNGGNNGNSHSNNNVQNSNNSGNNNNMSGRRQLVHEDSLSNLVGNMIEERLAAEDEVNHGRMWCFNHNPYTEMYAGNGQSNNNNGNNGNSH